jgi:hypothetical protein
MREREAKNMCASEQGGLCGHQGLHCTGDTLKNIFLRGKLCANKMGTTWSLLEMQNLEASLQTY